MVVPLILINRDLQYTRVVMKNALGPARKRPVSLAGACFVPVSCSWPSVASELPVIPQRDPQPH